MSVADAPVTALDRGSVRSAGRLERFWESPRWPLPPPRSQVGRRVLVVVAVAALVVRFLPAGPLWFDEAQSVAIAHMPIPQLLSALRQDGSPPLYYLALHFWMLVAGNGTWAVRALSGLMSTATVPLFAVLARRMLPAPARWPAVVLLACSPFAIRYAVETRMYALVLLLVVVGGILLVRCLEQPTWERMAPLPLISAALALTHYWALFLLAVAGAMLTWSAVRNRSLAARRAAIGLAGGGILYLPWLPSMLFQVTHTGTPWAHAGLLSEFIAFGVWAGTMHGDIALVFAVPLACILLAVVLWAAATDSRIRPTLGLCLATLGLASATSIVLDSAVVPRYTSVGLIPYLLVAAVGLAALPDRARDLSLRACVVLGLLAGAINVTSPRTLAGQVAGVLHREGGPGDVVVYCPDQLGPDVARLLPGWPQQLMFPTGAFPYRVDWVDYRTRNVQASPLSFAQTVVADSSDQPIWLVESDNYESFGSSCQQLATDFAGMRTAFVVTPMGSNPMAGNEQERLVEYLPNPRL